MKYSILLVVASLFCIGLNAQIPDSIKQETQGEIPQASKQEQALKEALDSAQSDSTSTKSKPAKKRFLKNFLSREDYPNPKKAFLYSAIIPGAGQIYNKKFWYLKVPIIYGGMGTMVGIISFNARQHRDFRDAYLAVVDEDPNTVYNGPLDATSLRANRNLARKNLEMSYVFLILMHLVQSAEAFVQGHLLTFDVSDDLSLQVAPAAIQDPQHQLIQPGIGLNLRLKNSSKETPRPFMSMSR